MLVELLPGRGGGGAEKRDMLLKLGLHSFNLLQKDTGGDDLTATGDGYRPVIFTSTNLAFYTPGVWISIGTFVWTNVGNRLAFHNVTSPLFGFTFQAPLDRCKT